MIRTSEQRICPTHLQDVTAEGPCFLCQGAELCPPLGEGSSRLQFAFEFAALRLSSCLPTTPGKKKLGKKRVSGRFDSYMHGRIRALMYSFDDTNLFLCMWNSLAFDSRARIWFYARHHNFVGLTHFVFSVDLSFRADADWSSSCTEMPAFGPMYIVFRLLLLMVVWVLPFWFLRLCFVCVSFRLLALYVSKYFIWGCLFRASWNCTVCIFCTALSLSVPIFGNCDYPVARACRLKKRLSQIFPRRCKEEWAFPQDL